MDQSERSVWSIWKKQVERSLRRLKKEQRVEKGLKMADANTYVIEIQSVLDISVKRQMMLPVEDDDGSIQALELSEEEVRPFSVLGTIQRERCQRDGPIEKSCDAVVVAMSESRCYTDSPVLAEHQPFNRNGKALRGSKKSVLFYTTDCGDEKEDLGLKLQQRSVSLVFLHRRPMTFHFDTIARRKFPIACCISCPGGNIQTLLHRLFIIVFVPHHYLIRIPHADL
ncbi:hypothetical protein ALC57_08905 [Trachymyrmex cornetzi]|uniref:Uncharacterized protein n=1 Tax=Trachymyrmex cornetzi TaxID=471704 RepID=A0A151J6B6_9HYME|nr:hypothetical protein ALC57_08905 [Trachymyrmex cornetzi]